MVKTNLLGGIFAFVLAAIPAQVSALIVPPFCALVDDINIYAISPMADGTALLAGDQRGDGIVYLLFPSNGTLIAVRRLDNTGVRSVVSAFTGMIASEEQFTVENILDRFSGGDLRSWTAEMTAELSNCLQKGS